jgi:hypothetical protein
MIVKNTYRPQAENVGDVDSSLPTLRVDLLVFTLAVLFVVAGTVSTVHFGLWVLGGLVTK